MRCTLSVIVLSMGLSPVAFAEPSFTASNGAVLPAPDVDTLTCGQIEGLMTSYSASGYRDFEPVPKDHTDHQIFLYEDGLARAHYDKCQMEAGRFDSISNAFSKGFK